MSIFSSLRREQKEAVGLLSIGTFLEYFDVMLYVHMAVLLNELFFPKTDAHATKLLAAFTFCSTWILRPIGALVFGYIGDNMGRKVTVIITTMMMAGSCILMANLPTYAQIGVAASWVMIFCRVAQGMSSMGEAIGAEIYLTEAITSQSKFPAVGLVTLCSSLGATFALGMASLIMYIGLNWRVAFWFGATIALIGSIARTTLRETPDFANAKNKMLNLSKLTGEEEDLKKNAIWNEKISYKTVMSLFFIQCMWPLKFYLTYVYCGNLLMEKFGYNPQQVIQHNFFISLIPIMGNSFLTYLSYYIYPIKILNIKWYVYVIVMIVFPFLLDTIGSPSQLFILQFFVAAFVPIDFPAVPIFYNHIPILKRFTYGCTIYAVGRAFMYVLLSFGLIYLVEIFGHKGIFAISIPLLINYKYGLNHFAKLEQESKVQS